jgi:hypothetical protein
MVGNEDACPAGMRKIYKRLAAFAVEIATAFECRRAQAI